MASARRSSEGAKTGACLAAVTLVKAGSGVVIVLKVKNFKLYIPHLFLK